MLLVMKFISVVSTVVLQSFHFVFKKKEKKKNPQESLDGTTAPFYQYICSLIFT